MFVCAHLNAFFHAEIKYGNKNVNFEYFSKKKLKNFRVSSALDASMMRVIIQYIIDFSSHYDIIVTCYYRDLPGTRAWKVITNKCKWQFT